MSADALAERLDRVRRHIAETAAACGRDPAAVTLIAVSKKQPAQRVREAIEAGQHDFGENYVQEALEKIDRSPAGARWHMIGHLQSNKAKQLIGAFDLIHTLDRPSLADALQKAAAARETTLDVLLQANLAGELSKSGAAADEIIALARRADQWPNLRIRGLMAIPPYEEEPERSRPHFRALRELSDRIRSLELPGVAMEHLSIGMSHDFPVAIEEGATLVRVGTAIFGERDA